MNESGGTLSENDCLETCGLQRSIKIDQVESLPRGLVCENRIVANVEILFCPSAYAAFFFSAGAAAGAA